MTDGVIEPYNGWQKSDKPNSNKSQEIIGDGWNGVVNGFFLGFTKAFYENFCYSDGDLFAEFDKFDKNYIQKYAGGCGKWGGQEGEMLRFKENGGKVFVIGECWIHHLKKRDWHKAKTIQKTKMTNYL